jgi:hypothetical protein
MRRLMRRFASALLLAMTLAPLAPGLAQRVVLSAEIDGTEVDLGAPALPRRGRADGGTRARALAWRPARQGISLATLDLHAGPLGAAVQLTLVRVDPSRVRFALQLATASNGMTGRWTIDSAPPAAVVAMNAGQFKETGPWGWLVLNGYENRDPGRAPLAIGIRIDTTGRIRWVPPRQERAARGDPTIAFAFQSFPLLLYDHRVPDAARDSALSDMRHRDARLVMAEMDDGSLLFALTRYGALGAVGERLPIGLTTPESIVLAIALGARHAVMLDGGTSAQLAVRDSAGQLSRWPGLRRVPLGLIALPR